MVRGRAGEARPDLFLAIPAGNAGPGPRYSIIILNRGSRPGKLYAHP